MDTRECEIHMKSGSLFCIFIPGPLNIFPDISNLQSSVKSHPDWCNKSVKKVVNDINMFSLESSPTITHATLSKSSGQQFMIISTLGFGILIHLFL